MHDGVVSQCATTVASWWYCSGAALSTPIVKNYLGNCHCVFKYCVKHMINSVRCGVRHRSDAVVMY